MSIQKITKLLGTPFHSGKVRDTWEIPGHPRFLLMVASNRLSTHNVIHASEVKFKGEVLTATTIFMAENVLSEFPTHIVAYGTDIYDYLPKGDYGDLHLRGLIVQRLEMIPYELIVRSYNVGGGSLNKYVKKHGTDPYGLGLKPMGIMEKFPEPIFTPTDKSEDDNPVHAELVIENNPNASLLFSKAYTTVSDYFAPRGITLLDAKGEMGHVVISGVRFLMFGDELFTPDCCRYAETKNITLGEDPPWLDKQVFRDKAEEMWESMPKHLGITKPACIFPPETMDSGIQTYLDFFFKLSDMPLGEFQNIYMS